MTTKQQLTQLAITTLRDELDLVKETNKILNSSFITFPLQAKKNNLYQDWLGRFTANTYQDASSQLASLLSTQVTVLPRICRGLEKCPYRDVCPFQDNLPMDLQCPLEMNLVAQKLASYMDEYNIKHFRQGSVITILNRVIELDLLDYRVSALLADRNADILINQTVSISMKGDPVEQVVLNPLLDLKEKISREKSKLLSVLVGTPEAQYKKQAALKEAQQDDYSRKTAQILNRLDQIEKKLV